MTELEQLRELLDQSRAKLGVHIRRMNSPGSPVYRAPENLVPGVAILVLSLGATALLHFYLGAAVLGVGCWWWLARHMPRVRDAVFERTAALVLSSERDFDFWWAAGALSLYAKTGEGEELAATRRNDWRQWVRSLPADLETLPTGLRETGGG
jgi:hypothetical protein